MRLSNKVAFITGGSTGIGKATAMRFAEEGAKVVIGARREELLKDTVSLIREKGGEASYCVLDIADERSVMHGLSIVKALYGGIDVLVNCAASYEGSGKTIEELTADEWDRAMSVNLKGYFLVCKHVVPYLRERGGGAIVNTSSISAKVAQRRFGAYSATKGGVEMLSKCMALDFGYENIRVNTVCPAYVLSERATPKHMKLGAEKLKELHPVGRPGYPADVANAILYLASDEASWVTGASLIVDGGYTCQ